MLQWVYDPSAVGIGVHQTIRHYLGLDVCLVVFLRKVFRLLSCPSHVKNTRFKSDRNHYLSDVPVVPLLFLTCLLTASLVTIQYISEGCPVINVMILFLYCFSKWASRWPTWQLMLCKFFNSPLLSQALEVLWGPRIGSLRAAVMIIKGVHTLIARLLYIFYIYITFGLFFI